jgi:hypothetical protein
MRGDREVAITLDDRGKLPFEKGGLLIGKVKSHDAVYGKMIRCSQLRPSNRVSRFAPKAEPITELFRRKVER